MFDLGFFPQSSYLLYFKEPNMNSIIVKDVNLGQQPAKNRKRPTFFNLFQINVKPIFLCNFALKDERNNIF